MNNVSLVSHDICSGCGACASICPKACVSMVADGEGFAFPLVDSQKCIECGACLKRCPVANKETSGNNPLESMILQDKDEKSLMESTSGGAFACIARHILKRGGAVFGAAYDDSLNVSHIAVTDIADLPKLQGSKYVSSDLKDSYKRVKAYLKDGRRVLFSGTPCQIAGLKSFLGEDSDMLLTVDLVCHGVPSQKLFQKYIRWLGEKKGFPIKSFCFRSKKFYGWSLGGACSDGKKAYAVNPDCDPYYAAFLRGETFRKSCYSCKFANMNRQGDFTVGDFWGFYNAKGTVSFASQKGMSLLLVNSSKGLETLKQLENEANAVPMDLDVTCSGNWNLYHPSVFKPIRDEIYANIDQPFDELQKKYLHHEEKFMYYVRRLRRKLLPQKIRNALNRLRH
ncbi:MAG: Coenzyme F420 hydrogenase/dehydrogenase, beta subunit C-terminal domain [Fibrobacter sp.]|nr:Coenzyme F420 hydrogenase/dehydrogenase, beta subunit C-terminal domain [Fibrobacter sp.]